MLLGDTDDNVGNIWEHLEEEEDTANVELVEDRLTHVWSMF